MYQVTAINTQTPIKLESSKVNQNNVRKINFKANEDKFVRNQPDIVAQMMNDAEPTSSTKQQPVVVNYPQPQMIKDPRKEFQKEKNKKDIMTAISIGAGLAIIISCLAGLKNMRAFDKGAKNVQELAYKDVVNEKTLEQLGLSGELAKTTDEIKIALERWENLVKKGAKGNSPILLYGEPGGGKNAYVYALTKFIESKYPGSQLIMMDVLKFNGMYHGQTENNIIGFTNNIIKKATSEPDKKFVVFLDEFDSIARKDISSNAANSEKFQNAFKTSFNSLLEVPNIQIIAATNKAAKEKALTNMLDEAIVNRFAYKVFVPLPDKKQLSRAFTEHYSSLISDVVKPELKDVNNEKLNKLCEYISKEDHHASFRDMNYILNRARILSESGGKSEPISMDNLVQAVKDHAESMNWKDINTLNIK